jgi:hypothetical protein
MNTSTAVAPGGKPGLEEKCARRNGEFPGHIHDARRLRLEPAGADVGFRESVLFPFTPVNHPMRIGLNSFLYASPFTTESTKLFAKFKKWGFDTVEIPVEDPSHIDPAKVRAAAEKAGIAIGSICACMGPGRDLRGSDADQKAGMDYCKA